MDFNTVYAQKLTTADRVAALVKDDDLVDYGWAIGTPVSFDAALAKRLPELHGIKFAAASCAMCRKSSRLKIRQSTSAGTAGIWAALSARPLPPVTLTIFPRYSELPRYYRESPHPLNIAVFVVAPMDGHGYFNLGPAPAIWPMLPARPTRCLWK